MNKKFLLSLMLFICCLGLRLPAQFNSSAKDIPKALLFTETWESGDFATNGWTFDPDQGNWIIASDDGNPAPAAKFKSSPPLMSYNYGLISPPVNITNVSGNINFEFDLFLAYGFNVSQESMKIYVLNDAQWVMIDSIPESDELQWSTYQYDITQYASGDNIQVKFEASGSYSFNIDYWLLDNINIYEAETAPDPAIDVTPDEFTQLFSQPGGQGSQLLYISNVGQENSLLEWSAHIEYAGNNSSWINMGQESGTIAAGETGEITLGFDAAGLENGSYEASIIIESNDPDEPLVTIPVTMEIIPPLEIPFTETWESGDFATNGWTFDPDQGNWIIASDDGNPAPAAKFKNAPPLYSYNYGLISPPVNITNASGNINFEFDLFLAYGFNVSQESMKIYVLNDAQWVMIDSIPESDELQWSTYQYDITQYASGDNIQVKFEASGSYSFNIDYWLLDNINIYEAETAPDPAIDVTPDEFTQLFSQPGGQGSQLLYISNVGQENSLLEWSAHIEYAGNNSSWINMGQESGTIAAGETGEITLGFDAAGLENGSYEASIIIESNDPDEPLVTIPVTMEIIPPLEIPFTETWESGDFATNGWTFDPDQGNWIIASDDGNPAPAAKFKSSPPLMSYNYGLISPPVNITNVSGNINFEFDLFLAYGFDVSQESMKIYVLNDAQWVMIDSIPESDELQWSTYQYDITQYASGDNIQVKFEASGSYSFNIDYWLLDNINIYEAETAPDPAIDVTPDEFTQLFSQPGGQGSQLLYISNVGQENSLLEWSALIEYAGNNSSWINMGQESGTIAAGETGEITLGFDAAGLENGSYEANIIIESNDPNEPLVTIPVTMDITVGIYESHALNISLYPNPVDNYLFISVDRAQIRPSIVTIYTSSGKLLFEKKLIESIALNVSSYPPGIYFLKVRSNNVIKTHKIVVQ